MISGICWLTYETFGTDWRLIVAYEDERPREVLELTSAEASIIVGWAYRMYYRGIGHFSQERHGWTWRPRRKSHLGRSS